MGFIRSLLEGKFEEQEAQHFQGLQDDLSSAVNKLHTVLDECNSTLKSIRSEEKEESETVSTLQEKILAFEEEVNNPLIQILITRQSFQDQISDTLYRQARVKNLIDRGVQGETGLAREKEREKDLQAAAILFEGEDGIRRLVALIERVRETMDEANDLREDLAHMLAKFREEPLDELEELDAVGERMNQLAKWL